MAVQATSDGWVIVTPLSYWHEERDALPPMRLHLAPADVQAWTMAVHGLGARTADSTTTPVEGIPLPSLGRGRLHMAPHVRPWRDGMLMELVTCDDVGSSIDMTAADLERFAVALDLASAVARRAAARPSLPTLSRPYYESEVSCGARLLTTNVVPTFPNTIPRAARRYTEIGVRFVVDTSGFIEPGSIAMLPGTPAVFARAVNDVVRGWHYRPAEWSGLPVRQIVNTVITFDPFDEATRHDPDRILSARRNGAGDPLRFVTPRPPFFIQSDGGWVHVAMGHWRPNGVFDGYQEWLAPDSVDTWVARVSQIVAADSVDPKYPGSTFAPGQTPGTPLYPDPMSFMRRRPGNSLLVEYQNGWSSDNKRFKLIAVMSGCGGGSSVPSTDVDREVLHRLTAASRAARRRRKVEPSLERSYGRGELACPSFLAPTSARRSDLPGVWRYPRAPYSDALSKGNVRAEVLTSFEVDTTGTPISATLQVAPGSDPRAVAALRGTIDHVHFNPAARAGMKVRTRVVRTWLFEPPAVCASEDDGIDCARMYGRGP